MIGKRVRDSQLISTIMMLPEHANPTGNVHGGIIMKIVDELGGMCAMRHSRHNVVTVVMDSMELHSPVHVGDMLTLSASLNWTGRTSMEVGVRVEAENLLTGKRTHTNTAFLVYVALDEQEKPVPVPPLITETPDEKRRWREAEVRQRRRLKRQQER
ncbi:MAG TPA: acyl-CoA thioesterase [Anaerolineae bacterium]|nr:acyl-CoA thioesterase [Anaerolineae bacterium]